MAEYIGQKIHMLPTPSAVISRPVLEKNCSRVLQAVDALSVGFRPHVKTHKTVEVSRLQLGREARGGKVVISTVREAEGLGPLIMEGVVKDILYGMPIPVSSIYRLQRLEESYSGLEISVLVDHPAQVRALRAAGVDWNVYVKLDMGTRRAGIAHDSPAFGELLACVKESDIGLAGFYCHAGHSYSVSDSDEALALLREEVDTAVDAAGKAEAQGVLPPLFTGWTLSVGATPTIISTAGAGIPGQVPPKLQKMISFFADLREKGMHVEFHAGVYTMLDLQQLSTHASTATPEGLGTSDLALTILAEVVSLYPRRGASGENEALINVGTVGLGREPGRAYSGWGTVSSWRAENEAEFEHELEGAGWVVGRISQEHGILTEVPNGNVSSVRLGSKVRIWPQHACIAGSGYERYFVVDEDEVVVGVWARWRGW
ncbi:unnamed protein product [Tuber melanosporum]|uniref:D-serine dehydratase n=1 Tax=Tuber melanosporum (strain Mel28) TaxID=656061 RepID=D5GN95_TUBMM|nr:uncharacterized protein GSTUM_00011166001 [Tuber melanosporum]CAZ85988.1 unnamed protein product [Tuber melanosporum]